MNKVFTEVAELIEALFVVLLVAIVTIVLIGFAYQMYIQNAFDNASLIEQARMVVTGNTPDNSVVMQALNILGIK